MDAGEKVEKFLNNEYNWTRYKDFNHGHSKSNENHIKIGYTEIAENHQEKILQWVWEHRSAIPAE